MSPGDLAAAASLAAVIVPAIASADPSAPTGETVTPVSQQAIPNVPGKSLAADSPPGA
jgi:hypothetical protein